MSKILETRRAEISPKILKIIQDQVIASFGTAFEQSEVKFDAVDKDLTQILDKLGRFETVINNIGFRLEALYMLLDKQGTFTHEMRSEADRNEAETFRKETFKEYGQFREKLMELAHLPLREKMDGLLEWNASCLPYMQIMANDLRIGSGLMEEASDKLTPEDRESYALKLGFEEGFAKAVKDHWEPVVEECVEEVAKDPDPEI